MKEIDGFNEAFVKVMRCFYEEALVKMRVPDLLIFLIEMKEGWLCLLDRLGGKFPMLGVDAHGEFYYSLSERRLMNLVDDCVKLFHVL